MGEFRLVLIHSIPLQTSPANSRHASITVFPFSDHDAPVFKFTLPHSPTRGRGVWKFNTLLLEDPRFVSKMEKFLLHWKCRKINFAHKQDVLWDMGKKKIRDIARKYSIKLARENRSKRDHLEKRIFGLSSRSDEEALNEVASLRGEIERPDLHKINGARIRAKELHISCNEKSSRYFFHLENKRQARKVITKLIDNNGTPIQGNKEILDYIPSFYEQFFSEEAITESKQTLLLNGIDNFLSNDASQSLEGPLFTQEC